MRYLGGLLEWIGLSLGVVVAGLLLAFLFARRRILKRVEKELGRDSILLLTGARVGFLDGAGGLRPAASSAGVLMLLSTGLYFHSWLAGKEIFVSGPAITWIGVTERGEAGGPDKNSILVRFLNAEGKEVGIIVRMIYPEQWVAAIKTHLITRAV